MSILRFLLCSLTLIASHATAAEPKTPATTAPAQGDTSTPALAQPLDPARGKEIGLVFEAFLSPHREPD